MDHWREESQIKNAGVGFPKESPKPFVHFLGLGWGRQQKH